MDNSTKSRQQQQNTLKCEICDKEFRRNNGLKNHLNLVHTSMEEHPCNTCLSVFNTVSE